jgi:hypothetical protein
MLLEEANAELIPSDIVSIDPRFAIPLALSSLGSTGLRLSDEIDRINNEVVKASATGRYSPRADLKQVLGEAAKKPEADEHLIAIQESINRGCGLSARKIRLLGLLSWPARATAYSRMLRFSDHHIGITGVRKDDWLTVLEPRRGTRFLESVTTWVWGVAIAGVVIASIVGAVVAFVTDGSRIPILVGYAEVAGVAGCILSVTLFSSDFTVTHKFDIESILLSFGTGTMFLTGAVVAYLVLPWYAVAVIIALIAYAYACFLLLRRRQRINDNPFRKCLDADASRLDDRTSVIST